MAAGLPYPRRPSHVDIAQVERASRDWRAEPVLSHESVVHASGLNSSDPVNEASDLPRVGEHGSPAVKPTNLPQQAEEAYGSDLITGVREVAEITYLGPPISLRALLEDARGHGFALGYRAALETAVLVAEALEQLPPHEVLADLSPESVTVSPNGGIVLGTGSVGERAASGVYAYRAPEQIKGLPPDLRANFFSLGSILFEELTGRPLFMRDDAATTMTAVLASRIPNLAEVLPDVPELFVRTMKRLLARAPDDRYPNATELLQDLHGAEMPSGPGAPSLAMLAAAVRARRDPESSLNGVDSKDLPPGGVWGESAPMFSSLPSSETVHDDQVKGEHVSWDGVLSVAMVSAVIVGLAVFWILTLT